jgi:molecular chaperone DnaK (HSP70)
MLTWLCIAVLLVAAALARVDGAAVVFRVPRTAVPVQKALVAPGDSKRGDVDDSAPIAPLGSRKWSPDGGVVLVDVVPLSMGIEMVGGVMSTVIARNTYIPCRGTFKTTTYADNGMSGVIELRLFEGESLLVKDNRLMGVVQITGMSPAPRGAPEVFVSFDVNDNDSILRVHAEEANGWAPRPLTVSWISDGRATGNNERGDEVKRIAREFEAEERSTRRGVVED